MARKLQIRKPITEKIHNIINQEEDEPMKTFKMLHETDPLTLHILAILFKLTFMNSKAT